MTRTYHCWVVVCYLRITHAGVCNTDEISLFSGTALYNGTRGIVQTCVLGARGVICDNNWDPLDAKVVCQQLGFSPYGNYCCTFNAFTYNYDHHDMVYFT